jgi:hypothetical protein
MQISAEIDAKPIAAGSRKLGPGEFTLGVIAPLYGGVNGFRSLSSALVAANGGDGSAMLATVDAYVSAALGAYLVKGTLPAKGTRCGSSGASVAPSLMRIATIR